MEPKLVDELPRGPGWSYEVKWDGDRAQLIKNGADIRLLSRKQKELTALYPPIVAAARRLPAHQCGLDGEIVGLDERGLPSFQALRHRARHDANVVFVAYDLLNENGEDLTSQALDRRRARLKPLVQGTGIQLSEPIADDPDEALKFVRERHLEGVVAKPKDSPYNASKSELWKKLKLDKQQEFVIGGFRPDGQAVDAILIGYFEEEHLLFAGKVRNGFTAYERRQWFIRLKEIETTQSPFMNVPISRSSRWEGGVTAEEFRSLRWVEPRLVVQIRYREWTLEGRLRHAYYLGIREDKSATDVHREAL